MTTHILRDLHQRKLRVCVGYWRRFGRHQARTVYVAPKATIDALERAAPYSLRGHCDRYGPLPDGVPPEAGAVFRGRAEGCEVYESGRADLPETGEVSALAWIGPLPNGRRFKDDEELPALGGEEERQ